uniref:Uncharacterized protein n=2 Tax=Chaetoceros debilis TaxID=122233 RepID=A0A7S3Q122_9STRA|mmetsp:Transcript_21414/g.32528  ORF Transcript_21414/g.32528 Transcript_21414/m.32528 type:complete len:485 (+) Transcript_21414:79-1533(+)
MGAIMSAVQMGAAWCCCNTGASLCNSVLGQTGVNATGRKRSTILLSFVILFALLFQYSLAPAILKENKWWKIYSSIPGMGKYLKSAFLDGCDMYSAENGYSEDLYLQCVSNAAVYRPTLVSTIFFSCTAIAAKMNPSLNKQIWPAKYSAFFISLLITLFIPNEPLFTSVYLLIMRICAMAFIFIQQIILIDMAYNWNESWVEQSNICESREWGSGKKWLNAIIISAVSLYIGSLTGIIFLYKYFIGEEGVSCGGNITVITFTLIGILAMTVAQLTGEDGSLLTTAVISAYSTYLAYSTVSKNPNSVCNPTLGNEDIWGIVVGLTLTMISLAWTGWSWTATERLTEGGVEVTRSLTPVNPARPDAASLNLDVPFIEDEDRPTTGLVMGNPNMNSANEEEQFNNRHGSSLWKLNVVLVLISCWVAASLTGWGTISGGIGEGGEHTAANPLVGRFNMVMICLSQTLAVGLYLWTLLAPRYFPDRDFS